MLEWNKMWSQCPRKNYIALKNAGATKVNIISNTMDEVHNLYDLGIRIFKTSGRGDYSNELFALNRFLEVAIDDEKTLLCLKYSL